MSASNWPEAVPVVASIDREAAAAEPRWSMATRIAFRFTFAFLMIANLPFPLNFVPKVDEVYSAPWEKAVPLVAQSVFGVPAEVLPNGSGDTTFNYVQFFLFGAIALVATLLWSLLDRKALSYPRLLHWLRVYVRFSLASAMIAYGAVKVIPSQFPAPSLDRLLQPFGDASPMGLLWTFMGASVAYNVFTGMGELLGGLLLTTRRTTLAGALVSAAVMTHVVVLNFSYDVPVKLYSSLLLLMALFLLAPYAKRLAQFLFPPLPRAAWWKVALRTAAVLAFMAFMFKQASDGRRMFGSMAPKSPLYGIWTVVALEENGVSRPPLVTDETRWRRLVFDGPRMMSIQLMSDQRNRYMIELTEKAFTLKKRDDPKYATSFTYARKDPNTLMLDGTMDGKKIHATLQKSEMRDFLLTTRGFHWINEYPFNR